MSPSGTNVLYIVSIVYFSLSLLFLSPVLWRGLGACVVLGLQFVASDYRHPLTCSQVWVLSDVIVPGRAVPVQAESICEGFLLLAPIPHAVAPYALCEDQYQKDQ